MTQNSKVIVSGLQPTGSIHIGNYLGAIKNWVSLIDSYKCLYFIVDYHSITVPYVPSLMQKRIYDAAVTYIACGLDPNKCTIFVQSMIPEHTELAWIFNTITPVGLLERMTQYKDKAQQQQSVNMGLLDYPVLQAADILLYKAYGVPIGEDQIQHLELTREIARKFNNTFGFTFEEPKTLLSKIPKIIGLDGKRKMSKSYGNTIDLIDTPQVIEKKLLPAVTDTKRVKRTDPGEPKDCNIFSLHTFFSKKEEIESISQGCKTAQIGCFDCKKVLAKNISEELSPIQRNIENLVNKRDYIYDVLFEGAKQAKKIAQETMEEVKTKLGLKIIK